MKRNRMFLWAGLLALASLAMGCATSTTSHAVGSRPFDFTRDTFAFANDVKWSSASSQPDFVLYCHLLCTDANRFYKFARFDAMESQVSEEEYARRVKRVLRTRFWCAPLPEEERIVIPGFADLRSFSAAHEALVKRSLGSKWPSVMTVRNWRRGFGRTRVHQERTAAQIVARLEAGLCDQLHIVQDGLLRGLDHSVLAYDFREDEQRIEFDCYDPNQPDAPLMLTYEKATRQFAMPKVFYYKGGPISVHRFYYAWWQ